MRLVGRLAAVLVVLLVVVVLAVGGLIGYVAGRALPTTSGTLHVAGLTGPVTVYRDPAGIAQIVADTPDDLFFAQGWVHASERMWQMEIWRHIGAGRLSELFGKSQLDTDAFIRTLGWRQSGEADYAAASPGTRRALERYAAGVNAWLDANKGKLGLPFVVAGLVSGKGSGLDGYQPEPWTPVDTTTFAKLQAWSLGGNVTTEIFKTLVDARLAGNRALTDALTPPYPSTNPTILDSGTGATAPAVTGTSAVGGPAASSPVAASTFTPAVRTGLARLSALAGSLTALAGLAPATDAIGMRGVGSNDWVVAPSKSATGTALLANDPHLGIQMPSIWFINGLHCRVVSGACPYDVQGVTFPGTPGVILGHNAKIAWGVTNVGPDVEDLFVETPDPHNPANYLYKGQSIPYTTRQETIKVAGGEPVTLTVRSTVHGPVVTDVFSDLKGSGMVYALRWTALTEPDGVLESFLGIDVASDFPSFQAAMKGYGAPSQNFVYADVAGNIGWQVPGRLPIRPKGDTGDRPVDGASGAHDWLGYVPFDELPHLYNPPSGMIVTANNQVVGPSYPYFLGSDWDAGWRAARITQMLKEAAARGGVTLADLGAIQTDTRLLRADSVVPAFQAAKPATTDGQRVQALVGAWNRRCDTASQGCAAYEVAEWRLLRAVFDPWLGTLSQQYVGTDPSRVALRVALADPASPFWNDPSTVATETRDERLAGALDAAGADLRAALGDPSRWTWGSLHLGRFEEQTLGTSGIAPLEALLDQGPFGFPGTSGAVLNTTTTFGAFYPDPAKPDSTAWAKPGTLFAAFQASTIPSYRFTIDLGNMDGARIVQTTGQSGNPFDRHYGDMIDDWIAGRTFAFPFTLDVIRKSAASTLTIEP